MKQADMPSGLGGGGPGKKQKHPDPDKLNSLDRELRLTTP